MKIQITGLCLALALGVSSHQAAAQGATFTYQGRVTDNGANFTGMGQFKFALVNHANTSSQARGIVDGFYEGAITHVSVLKGGSGYLTAPAVTLDYIGPGLDHGGGVILTAVVSGGVVTAINVTAGGTNYPNFVGEYWATVVPPPDNYANVTLWNNDGTGGSEPAASVPVAITNGLFTLALGDTTLSNMTAIPATLFSQYSFPNLQLQIWFNDGVNGFGALSPAEPLTPAPTAVFADTASNLVGTLPTSQLSGVFSGDGSGLTSLPAGNLTGSIPAAALIAVPAASLTGTLPAAVLPVPLTLIGGLNVDNMGIHGANPGTVISNALVFGTGPLGSGEGIASKRVGVNPYDLEFFTGFKNRMTINSSGNVGIVSTSPEGLLEIQGGADGSGANDKRDIALAYRDGGYRHWIRTRHSSTVNVNPSDNAIDFYVNNSTSATGSSAPGTGSVLVMSLNGGNVGIATAEPTHLLVVNNAYCDGNQWYPSSDRNVKAGFESLSSQDVLAKVAGLPISRWHYTNDLATAHVGPMAQDFYAAFGIGPDDKHIGSSDEGGVALAAIQGLDQKLEETRAESKAKDAEIRKFKEQNDTLAQRLADLEATVKALAERK